MCDVVWLSREMTVRYREVGAGHVYLVGKSGGSEGGNSRR